MCQLLTAFVVALSAIMLGRCNYAGEGKPLGNGLYSTPTWSRDSNYLVFEFEQGIWLYDVNIQEFRGLNIPGMPTLLSGAGWDLDGSLWLITLTEGEFLFNRSLYKIDIQDQTSRTCCPKRILTAFHFTLTEMKQLSGSMSMKQASSRFLILMT